MGALVLIHGGWAGGWVWEKVAASLRAQGHHVEAPDLPGHGRDDTPVTQITMDSYVARTLEAVDAAAEPVVLVGHSSGGMIISQAAEHRPERIRSLVYLSAMLPQNGQTILDIVQADPLGQVGPNMIVGDDPITATLNPDAVRSVLFNDCAEADYLAATARFRPEPLAPAGTPVKLTPERFGSVPRVYIECLRDNALSLPAQRRLQQTVGCQTVLTLGTGHMPQYAAPDALAGHLHDLARSATH